MICRKTQLDAGLYFVGTPIGCARDITLRALDTLALADVLAAEDTRSLMRLLRIHEIVLDGRTVVAYHEHSGDRQRGQLLREIDSGRAVAYASEAGMPMVSDPGYLLGKAVIEAGHSVTCVPGPSALTTALVMGGLPTDAAFFGGFLPASRGARVARLEAMRHIQGTLILFESPRRLASCLEDLARILGAGRRAAVCREMTKKFEEVRRGTLGDLATLPDSGAWRGEIVVLVDRADRDMAIDEDALRSSLREAFAYLSVRDASDLVARQLGISRRTAYRTALDLVRDGEASRKEP